jgi:hypothetical protein
MHLIVKVLQDLKIFAILGHKDFIEISAWVPLSYYFSHRPETEKPHQYKAQDGTIFLHILIFVSLDKLYQSGIHQNYFEIYVSTVLEREEVHLKFVSPCIIIQFK